MSYTCPHCKQHIICDVVISKAGKPSGFVGASRQTFKQTAEPLGLTEILSTNGGEHIKEAYRPQTWNDVFIPVANSFIGGAFAFGITDVIIYGGFTNDPQILLTLGAAAFLVTSAAIWGLKNGLGDDVLWAVEKVTGWDINGDGKQGKPEPAQVNLNLERFDETGGYHSKKIALPKGISLEAFTDWAHQVAHNIKPAGREHWTGDGQPFGRPTYDKMTKWLMEAEICDALIMADDNDGRGRYVTEEGKKALKRWLRQQSAIR